MAGNNNRLRDPTGLSKLVARDIRRANRRDPSRPGLRADHEFAPDAYGCCKRCGHEKDRHSGR